MTLAAFSLNNTIRVSRNPNGIPIVFTHRNSPLKLSTKVSSSVVDSVQSPKSILKVY